MWPAARLGMASAYQPALCICQHTAHGRIFCNKTFGKRGMMNSQPHPAFMQVL
jgi:hypothetical protein